MDLERALSRFIWHNKRPRIRIKTLQLPTVDRGGLALPNLRFYNWACHTRLVWDWLQSHLKSEAGIDEWFFPPYSPLSKLTDYGKKRSPDIKHNSIIYNTIRVWRDICFIMAKVKNLHTGIPSLSDIDSFLLNQKDTRHFLSHSYSLLYSLDPSDIKKVICCDFEEEGR